MRERFAICAGIAFILLATFAAYRPATHNGYIWDDAASVTENQLLRSNEGLKKIWLQPGIQLQYYPLVHSSFWLEYHLWGLNPRGYHVVNVLLHSLNALLLWFLLCRLKIPGAWLAAALFALHPVHVESVAWISERKNVLSGALALSALLAYLRFSLPAQPSLRQQTASAASTRWAFFLLAQLCFICALLSKTVTAVLPLVILLLLWWKRERLRRQDLFPLIPMFIFGAGMGSLTAWLEKYRVGAQGLEWEFSLIDRSLIAGRALWFYVEKLLWPAQLTFIYPRWDIDAGVWWQYLFPLAAVVVVISLWIFRGKIGKGPLISVACSIVLLAPALGFIDFYPMRFSFVADHFQYLASIPLIAGFAILLQRGGRSWPSLKVGFAAMILTGFSVLTWNQGFIYRDRETLWRDTLEKNPLAFIAHNNLGMILYEQERFKESLLYFQEALRLNPDYAEAHYSLGTILLEQMKLEEALRHFREALRIVPNYAKAHSNLGNVLSHQKRFGEAIHHYRESLRFSPDDAITHFNLGRILFEKGNFKEALQSYSEALRLQPRDAKTHFHMGNALFRLGDLGEAIRHYTEALRLDPDYPQVRHNLGVAHSRLRKGREGE